MRASEEDIDPEDEYLIYPGQFHDADDGPDGERRTYHSFDSTSLPTPTTRRGGASISSPCRVVLATNDLNSEIRIATTIKHYGHFVQAVRSGAALMDIVKREVFDVAIVDVSLTDYDRISMAELVNPTVEGIEVSDQPAISVVGLAGEVSEAVRARCVAEGINELLSKPPSDLMIDTVIRSIPCQPEPISTAPPKPAGLQHHQQRPTLLKMNTAGNVVALPRQTASTPNHRPPPLPKVGASLLKKAVTVIRETSTASPRPIDDDIDDPVSSPLVPMVEQPATTLEEKLRAENSWLHQRVSQLSSSLSMTRRTLDAVIPPQYQKHIAPDRQLVLGKVACRPLTIMFSDIRNFSRQSENMSVDALMDFVNGWLSFALPPVSVHGGFVDKFIGDSILCIFAHDDVSNSAVEAVRAAIEIMNALDYMNGLHGLIGCDTGVGINTGKCMMGVLGIETRMEPTVIGDSVNLASRTESLTKKYGARILITEHTKVQLGAREAEWVIRAVDHVYVVGKSFPVRIYEVIDGDALEARKKKIGFMENGWWPMAVTQFEAGHFAQALQNFQKCLHVYPLDIPSRIYIQRCHENMQPDFDISTWQPIYPLDSK